MAFSKIMISAVPLSVLLIALAAQVHGATRNSTSYSILTDTADGGGRRATSSTYTVDGSVGSVLGISTIATPLETVRNGYIGQIFDLTGLVVNAVSPSAVAAWQVLDDASLFAISATNNGFRATGLTLGTIALGFAPTEGQVLMLVNNTSASAILGTFSSLPQGSIITASYGGINYSFAISYTGGTGNDIILTGLAPQAVAAYRDWARLRFGQQNISDPGLAAVLWGPKVDTDHDGRDNLTEFAMGSDPLVPDFTPITQIEVRAEGGGNRLYLWFNRRVASPDVDYIPGVSSDLTNWFTDAAHVEFVAALALGNGYEEAEYRDLTMLTSEGGRFCRLLLSYRNVSLPQIALTGPAANSYFVTGDSLSLAANVADTGGGIMAVEFYADGVLIGRGSGAPFSLTWTPPGTAPVSITVRAIDYMGNITDSAPNLVRPNHRPTIVTAEPSSPTNFHAEGPVQFAIIASDADGDLVQYQLFLGATALTPLQASPLSWQPTAADKGPKALTIKATDSKGATTQTDKSIYIFRTPPGP